MQIFLEKKQNKKTKTLTMLVERINVKIEKKEKIENKPKTLSMLVERRNVRLPKAESGRKGSLKPVAVYF